MNIKTISFSLFSLLSLVLSQAHYKKTRGFCLEFIQHPIGSNHPLFFLEEATSSKMHQTFKYLACGRQCFVFESEDKSIVLKFLSAKRFLQDGLFHKSEEHTQNDLLDQELKSYHIAFHHLFNESKILGIKLGDSENLPHLTLIDPLGIKRQIDLNKAEFIIQPKAIHLSKIYESKKNLEPFLERVKQLLHKRYQQNILDHDPRIHRNLGAVNDDPFFLDLGSFYKPNSTSEEEKALELEKILKYNQQYLQN